MVLHLVRHTRPAVNPDLCYGRLDVELASSWRHDLESALRGVPIARQVFSSPSLRCRVLAEALGARDGVGVKLDERLLELDFGTWEGRPWSDIPHGEIDAWNRNLLTATPGGGESLATLWNRVMAFWQELAPAGEPATIVTHHGPIRAIAAQFDGRPPDTLFDCVYPCGSVTRLEVGAEAFMRVPPSASSASQSAHAAATPPHGCDP